MKKVAKVIFDGGVRHTKALQAFYVRGDITSDYGRQALCRLVYPVGALVAAWADHAELLQHIGNF